MLGEFGCKRPAVSSEKFCKGVRDPWYYPESSMLGVRDPRCDSKSFVLVLKTHEDIRKFSMGVRDPWREPKVLYGCKRPTVLSEKFCVGVKDPRCNLKSSIAQKEYT